MDELNFDDLEQAETSAELTYKISNEDYYNLLELVDRTTFDMDQRLWIIIQIDACETMDEYEAIRKNLLLNRIERKDRVSMGFNYDTVEDINCMIRRLSKDSGKIKLKKL